MNQSYPESGENAAMDPVADLLGSGRVVAFKVDLGLAFGSATAGLWLSQFWFWVNTAKSAKTDEDRWDGEWMCWKQDEICEQTALTRRESDTARRDLRATGVLQEEKRGLPMRIWYRLDKAKLYQLLRAYCDKKATSNNLGAFRQDDENDAAAPDNVGENEQPILAENANQYAQNRQTVATNEPVNLGGKRQVTIGTRASENSRKNNTYQKKQHENSAPVSPLAPSETSTASDNNVAVVFVNKCDEASELTALVAGLGIGESDAASIVREALQRAGGAERIKRNADWFPTSKQARDARNTGATFRQAMRGDWARVAADEKFAAQMDDELAARARNRAPSSVPHIQTYDADPTAADRNDEANMVGNAQYADKTTAAVADLASRRIMQAPPPPSRRPATDALAKRVPDKTPAVDVEAIWVALSPCAQERLHKEAVARAAASAPFRSDEITEVTIDASPETRGMAARLVLATRNEILRERAVMPIVINGRNFYDAADARAAQIDLDFN